MVASAATMTHVTATTFSGLMPESSARSSLSEKARIDLPVRVRFRNQNSSATQIAATVTVRISVVRITSGSSSPVASRKPRAETTKRAPSAKRWSSTPMMKRTSPLRMNITPMETITKITGAAFCWR